MARGRPVLGIDIGGVIITRIGDGGDTSFQKDFLNTPAVADAMPSIRQISDRRFGSDIYLVSKCGPAIEKLTREWLDAQNFFERTSVPKANIRFCARRDQKEGICASLGITHFVDDRLEVLSYLRSVVNLYLFQPRQREVDRFKAHLDRVKICDRWTDLLRELATLDRL